MTEQTTGSTLPLQIFEKLDNENAIKPKIGDPWQFCPESLNPPPPPPGDFGKKI
jgi:hypothetical protein